MRVSPADFFEHDASQVKRIVAFLSQVCVKSDYSSTLLRRVLVACDKGRYVVL